MQIAPDSKIRLHKWIPQWGQFFSFSLQVPSCHATQNFFLSFVMDANFDLLLSSRLAFPPPCALCELGERVRLLSA